MGQLVTTGSGTHTDGDGETLLEDSELIVDEDSMETTEDALLAELVAWDEKEDSLLLVMASDKLELNPLETSELALELTSEEEAEELDVIWIIGLLDDTSLLAEEIEIELTNADDDERKEDESEVAPPDEELKVSLLVESLFDV
jgi:hypothetical protein